MRVGPVVAYEKPRVHGDIAPIPGNVDGVGVATWTGVCLEEGDVMLLTQKPGAPETRYAASNDCYTHPSLSFSCESSCAAPLLAITQALPTRMPQLPLVNLFCVC